MKNILNTFRSTIRGGYEVYLSFALLGALILLRRRKWNWEFTAFIGLYLVHFVIYERIVTSYRYSIYLIPLFMPFTLTGLMFAGEKGREFLVKKQPGSLKYLPLFLGIGIVALFFIQAVNGMKCVTDRKDIPHHKAAAFIREYAEKNFPGRRCKIAALEDCVETLYWTGASSVWGYKEYEIHGKAFYRTDFDLLLSSRKEKQEFPASCGDLLEIQTPEDFPVRIFRKVEKNQ